MAKESDSEAMMTSNAAHSEEQSPSPDRTVEEGATSGCPFTLRIIHQNGQEYYEVSSEQLGDPMPLGESSIMQELVERQIDMAHVANGSGESHILLCGTFFVNLHVFK